MNNERRIFGTTELRVDNTSMAPAIVGYAALFNSLSEDLGGFKEIIEVNAFSNVLENDVRALINHDENLILGRNKANTLQLNQDEKGLQIRINPPDTSYANDLLVSIQRGDVSQMSFGFIVGKEGWKQVGQETVRTIKTIDRLLDVSVVTFPAYPETSVALRSKDNYLKQNIENIQSLRNLLRLKSI